MEFSIRLDAMSFMVVAILALFHYDRNSKRNQKYQLFNCCLALTACSILLDIITCLMIERMEAYPEWAHMLANSLYFVAIYSCSAMIAKYVFYLLFEHMKEQKCYKIACRFIRTSCIVLNALILVNVWTGCYFYIENGQYCRGPLNKIGFLVMLVEAGMLCMCYFRNRKVITPYAVQLVKSIPVLTALLTIAQFVWPDMILTGTMAALVNLILFACFQNNRIGRDALTELLNRPSFFREVNYYIDRNISAHLVLVHLCNLEKVNKRFGMSQGDRLLYNVARYLENLDSEYSVYRYGNTHFMMLGTYQSEAEAERLVNEVFGRFEKLWKMNDVEWHQQIQLIHMKLKPEEAEENRLTEQLRYLLDSTKDNHESTRVYFDDEIKAAYERKVYVLNEVKKALEKESFVLYFQPVYSCATGKFMSAEVLLRLFAEDGTMISPSEFIPLAEENALSDEITWLVLKKSMEFVVRHPDIPLESISVNMSIQQMNAGYLYDKIEYAKQTYQGLLGKLRIEITERVITQNPELVIRVMKSLVKQGMSFYLDDFGVGYSNFSRVFELPFEIIKLDRSLLLGIEKEEKTYQTIRSLVELLHNAGFSVIAEGLETKEQVDRAMAIGVDRIQGFYFAKPMGEAQLISFLQEHT